MKKFVSPFSDDEIVQAAPAQLVQNHIQALIDKISD